MRDTIFALSSGAPPAAIAIVRISGPHANAALQSMAGRMPTPRRATLAMLRDPLTRAPVDHALVIRFGGPATATGEDLVELHLHGGRSVVSAALAVLSDIEGLRPAQPGEFTRRAYENGRIDLAEAEGLADLLMAETDSQRRAALALAGGALSREIDGWQQRLLGLAALIEAQLDFSDEDDVGDAPDLGDLPAYRALMADLSAAIGRPPIERLKDGIRIVITGPPNAGKSTLFNRLVGREAAITSPIAGTTRDVIEAPVAIAGTPMLLVDTAGLRDEGDSIEAIGIERARASIDEADIILWLGEPASAPDSKRTIRVAAKSDIDRPGAEADVAVSALTDDGMAELIRLVSMRTVELLPREGEATINTRHRLALEDCLIHLVNAGQAGDPIVSAEELRLARHGLDRITGRGGVEAMLDALFGAFCIGK